MVSFNQIYSRRLRGLPCWAAHTVGRRSFWGDVPDARILGDMGVGVAFLLRHVVAPALVNMALVAHPHIVGVADVRTAHH